MQTKLGCEEFVKAIILPLIPREVRISRTESLPELFWNQNMLGDTATSIPSTGGGVPVRKRFWRSYAGTSAQEAGSASWTWAAATVYSLTAFWILAKWRASNPMRDSSTQEARTASGFESPLLTITFVHQNPTH